jgi:hypothetical protein
MDKHIKERCQACDGKGYRLRVAGKWLRAQRVAAALSLRDMAKLTGFSPAFLSDCELGRRRAGEILVACYERAPENGRKG